MNGHDPAFAPHALARREMFRDAVVKRCEDEIAPALSFRIRKAQVAGNIGALGTCRNA